MFEYMRDLLCKIIETNMQKCSELSQLRHDVECEILRISTFQDLDCDVKTYQIKLVFWGCLLSIFLGTTIIFNVNILFVLGALLSTIKLIDYKKELSQFRDYLNVNYQDYVCFTKKELEQQKNDLICQKQNLISEIRQISEIISENNASLSMFDNYEESDKFFSSGDGLCLKEAKDFSELNLLREKNQVCIRNSFDDYLNEKPDYTNIHFDSSVGESIAYTENSKKLIKKM